MGALLSTVLAALKIIEYRRDRAIIVVKLDELRLQFDPRYHVNVSVVGGLGEERSTAETRWLQATIINIGRRTARVTGVLLMLPRGSSEADDRRSSSTQGWLLRCRSSRTASLRGGARGWRAGVESDEDQLSGLTAVRRHNLSDEMRQSLGGDVVSQTAVKYNCLPDTIDPRGPKEK